MVILKLIYVMGRNETEKGNKCRQRIYVEKKPGYDIQAAKLKNEFRENLGIHSVERVRILNRYDVENITEDDYRKAKHPFSQSPVDYIYEDKLTQGNEKVFG